MRKAFVLVAFLSMSLLSACSSSGPVEGTVTAVSLGDALYVTNQTNRPVFYFVVGREEAKLLDWAPTRNSDFRLLPGETVRIPPAQLHLEQGEDVFVNWWHAVLQGVKLVPGTVHAFVVPT